MRESRRDCMIRVRNVTVVTCVTRSYLTEPLSLITESSGTMSDSVESWEYCWRYSNLDPVL